MIKIAVRSYGRSDSILKKTLGFLQSQKDLDLANQLVLAVADEDEYEKYKNALGNNIYQEQFPIKDIIITARGGFAATNGLINYFPEGEQVIFMDDDISSVKGYTDIMDKDSRYEVNDIGRYFTYAFEKFEDCPFGFDFTPNLMFKQGKPFAEFKMRKIGGAWWGAYNDKKLLKTAQSHEDDNIRSAKALKKFGGVGAINWLVATTAVGINIGGMQASGDRGDGTKESMSRSEKTKAACWSALDIKEVAEFYQNEPVFIESMNFWSLRLKNIRELRKMYPLNQEIKWSGYFQHVPDPSDSTQSLDEFF